MSDLAAPLQADAPAAGRAPYARGDRIELTGPDGTLFRARVEAIEPVAHGGFAVVAAVCSPRRFRHLLIDTVVSSPA